MQMEVIWTLRPTKPSLEMLAVSRRGSWFGGRNKGPVSDTVFSVSISCRCPLSCAPLAKFNEACTACWAWRMRAADDQWPSYKLPFKRPVCDGTCNS